MAAVAAYASSDSGRFHAIVSENYGVDPAAGIHDDVVAANLRAALFLSTRRTENEAQGVIEQGPGIVNVSGLDPLRG